MISTTVCCDSVVCCAFVFMHVERKRNSMQQHQQPYGKKQKKKNNKRDTYRSYRESVMNVIEDWKITGVRIKQKWESDSCLNNAEGLIVCLAVACMFEWEHIKPNIVYTSVETTWKMEKQLWLFWDWIVTKPNSQTARCWWRGLFAWDCSCTDEYMVHRFATFDNW